MNTGGTVRRHFLLVSVSICVDFRTAVLASHSSNTVCIIFHLPTRRDSQQSTLEAEIRHDVSILFGEDLAIQLNTMKEADSVSI